MSQPKTVFVLPAGGSARFFDTTAILLGMVLATVACTGETGPKGPKGRKGDQGEDGSSCSASEEDNGGVIILCGDGTKGTVSPPDGDGAAACIVTRTENLLTITCPEGSDVKVPLVVTDAGTTVQYCEVSTAGDGTITITCPTSGATISPPTSMDAGPSGPILVGPTRAACGACHDSQIARGHFTAMTVEVDGQLQETCGTCHNETSIEPVSRVHARPELGPPGLKVTIDAVSVIDVTVNNAPAKKAKVSLTITDGSSNPLPLTGISWNFTIAKIAGVTPVSQIGTGGTPAAIAGPYVSYVTRTVTQVDTPSFPLNGQPPRVVTQPTSDRPASNNSNFVQTGEGKYDYTFTSTLPSYDGSLSHVVAVYATRNVGSVRFVTNAEHFFVPDDAGATPLVRTASGSTACNSCHNPLSAHGGSRQDYQLCLTCHTQGAVDPESNHSIDFNVMVHRIHMGKQLPSVQAGTPYQIIGNGASLHDFGAVGFPQDIQNCQTCHNDPSDERWVTNGTKEACSSCHDDIYKPGVHPSFTPDPVETTCGNANCHSPGNGKPRDAREAHVTSLNNLAATVFELSIESVTLANADEAPSVRIHAATHPVDPNGAITPVASTDQLQTLTVYVNGPNSAFQANGNNLPTMTKANLVNLVAVVGEPGDFTFALPKTLRQLVAGLGDPDVDSYTLTIRATYDPTPADANDRVNVLRNPSAAFGVGETVEARLAVVDTDKCNSCHADLSGHGGAHKNVEECVMCHTATLDTRVRQAANKAQGPTTSLRFSHLIHRVHAGGFAELPYTVYGYSQTPPYPEVDLSHIVFPGTLKDCTTSCHVGAGHLLPLPETTSPTETVVLDADGAIVP